MTELHDSFIEAVGNANRVVQDSVEQTKYWMRHRNDLAYVAHVGGTPIEAIADGLGESAQTVRSWIIDASANTTEGSRADGGTSEPPRSPARSSSH